MILKDVITYLDSENYIIHNTPCMICGSQLEIEGLYVETILGLPHHLCICRCPNCGEEKVFIFSAPYLKDELVIPPEHALN
ncbi:hypothetical protein SAMN02745248_01710 [Hathewaya proteolytica DSM 3090]|uniref:Metal-binding protein n=1 Tax=Hathewaya proteolytica DSM 3090 TaxID=1121331 RepID=A0A1M6PI83_9CLOT|nr:hypothetical protein [Hathewaya proteolytica]SHK07627.1 hypothetical protein SAMN02745248_01710 [Hathewaya proteolytica DSM 3090]